MIRMITATINKSTVAKPPSALFLWVVFIEVAAEVNSLDFLEFADSHYSRTGRRQGSANPGRIILNTRGTAAVSLHGGRQKVAAVSKSGHQDRSQRAAISAARSN